MEQLGSPSEKCDQAIIKFGWLLKMKQKQPSVLTVGIGNSE